MKVGEYIFTVVYSHFSTCIFVKCFDPFHSATDFSVAFTLIRKKTRKANRPSSLPESNRDRQRERESNSFFFFLFQQQQLLLCEAETIERETEEESLASSLSLQLPALFTVQFCGNCVVSSVPFSEMNFYQTT